MSRRSILNNLIANIKGTQNTFFKFKLKNLRTFLSVVLKLLEYGCITKYLFKEDGYIHIYKNLNSSVTLAQVPKQLLYQKYHQLESLMSKNPTSIYIVSTSIGILDNFELRKLRLGGELLFIIKQKNNKTTFD